MTFDDYQKQALKTVLPTANNLPYIALGLTNEAGEVAGKVKKWVRDDGSDMTRLDKAALVDELGDTLWYLALMAQMLEVNLSEIAEKNISKLADRQKRNKLHGSGDTR